MEQTVLERHAGIRRRFDRALLSDLAQPAPGRLLFQTGIEWCAVVLLIAVASWSSNVAISLLCMMLIATRQHALMVLMHEYSHFQFSRERAWLNDLIGDVLTAFPFLITIHGFRRSHLRHHRASTSADDAHWMALLKKDRYCFPKTRRQVLIELLKHSLGCYTLADLKGYTVDAGMALDLPRATRVRRAVFILGLLGAVVWFGLGWIVLLYWIVPLGTFTMAILYLRDMGEHFGLPAPGLDGARTVLAGWIERALICQNGANFHTEHHLFPSVPFFRLSQLHGTLLNDSGFRQHAVCTQGYLTGLIDEVGALPSGPPEVRSHAVALGT